MENEVVKAVSLECLSCESDFLALTNSKEYELNICYRCFFNGMADSYMKRIGIENR